MFCKFKHWEAVRGDGDNVGVVDEKRTGDDEEVTNGDVPVLGAKDVGDSYWYHQYKPPMANASTKMMHTVSTSPSSSSDISHLNHKKRDERKISRSLSACTVQVYLVATCFEV